MPAWSLDKNGVTPSRPLTNTQQLNLNTFMNAVRAGLHPRQAAKGWEAMYEEFGKGSIRQAQIRLSGGERATFMVNDTTGVVTMMQVGGHT